MNERWEKDKAIMEKFIRKPLEDVATNKGGDDADIGDGDTLLRKLEAIDSQIFGHFVEVGYGVEKIAKGKKFVRFGAYEYEGERFGADVTCEREANRGTGDKAVQIKAVSARSSSGVLTVIKKASMQLAGATASGEKPHDFDQRVIAIYINNERNNFPYTDGDNVVSDGNFSAKTAREIYDQLKARLNDIKTGLHEEHIDKIKIIYTPPRQAQDQMVRAIVWEKKGGIRSDEQFRKAKRQYVVREPKTDKQGKKLPVMFSPEKK